MNFTQTQITKILDEIKSCNNGYQEILKLSLDSIMRSGRQEFNKAQIAFCTKLKKHGEEYSKKRRG